MSIKKDKHIKKGVLYLDRHPDIVLPKYGYVKFREMEWHKILTEKTRFHIVYKKFDPLIGHLIKLHHDDDFHKSSDKLQTLVIQELRKISKDNVDIDSLLKERRRLISKSLIKV